jgi:peroxiredoxin
MFRIPVIISFFAILFFVLISCSRQTEFSGRFGYSPSTPNPAEEITIMYNPDSTILSGMDEVKCIAYLYSSQLNNTVDVPLNKDGNMLTGKLTTKGNTLGVILKFKSGDVVDNNDKSGYIIFLTGNDGERLPGSLAGLAAAHNKWGAYYIDLERDRDKAYNFFEEEFKANPQVKQEFLQAYFETVNVVRVEDSETIITAELETLEKRNELSEENYKLLADWYSKLNNPKKVELYEKIINEKFPQSEYVQIQKYLEFRNLEDVNDKIVFAKKYENEHPGTEYIEYMHDLIANSYRDAKDYKSAYEFLKNNAGKVSTYRFYSVSKRMIDEKTDLKTALEIAKLGVEINRQEVEKPSGDKPEFYSDSEWKEQRKYYLGLNLFAYGNILYNIDEKGKSLPALEEAVDLTKSEDGSVNELYSKALVENGNYGKAMDEISVFIETGHGTSIMKDLLKEAYLNEKGSDEGFSEYAARFEDTAKENLKLKLEKEMILERAPVFTLNDLDGNIVSLADYKGKTVIIDFWATWCGPCRASFPGMKISLEKYNDNENVKFFFVNSWERVEDKHKSASEFIAKNEYPFRVLMDEENKVIEMFKVSGIPTKFIIDGEGNIRFKSVGFPGTDEQLVEEMDMMISMLN